MNTDDRLDSILREIARQEDPDWRRPPEEAVRAYIRGQATEEQVRDVQAALIGSPAFRQELVDLAETEQVREAGDLDTRAARAHRPPWIFRPRNLVPAGLALAAVLAVSLIGIDGLRRDPPIRADLAFIRQLRTEQFERGAVRGEDPPESQPATPRAAATRKFREMITWQEGNLDYRDPGTPASDPGPGRVLSVHVFDEAGIALPTHAGTIPAGAGDPVLWVLFLPSLRLHTADVPPGRNAVRLDLPPGNEAAAITITYEREGKPEATSPWLIRFPD